MRSPCRGGIGRVARVPVSRRGALALAGSLPLALLGAPREAWAFLSHRSPHRDNGLSTAQCDVAVREVIPSGQRLTATSTVAKEARAVNTGDCAAWVRAWVDVSEPEGRNVVVVGTDASWRDAGTGWRYLDRPLEPAEASAPLLTGLRLASGSPPSASFEVWVAMESVAAAGFSTGEEAFAWLEASP